MLNTSGTRPLRSSPRARHKFALGSVQAGNQVLAQVPTERGIDAVVDGLVRDGALGVIGQHTLECACLFAGRPLLRQKVLHHAKEQCVNRQIGAAPRLESVPAGTNTSRAGIVGTIRLKCRHKSRTVLPSGKALEFLGDGRERAEQGARDVARRAMLVPDHYDRGSLFRCEKFVVRSHSSTLLDGCST
jgi:hypothetical protein